MTENNIGRNLKYLRKKSGLTQANIRSQLGITRSTWSNYENGITTPAIGDLISFSRHFGISLDELILHDLSAKEPLPVKRKYGKEADGPAVYPINEIMSATAEPTIGYVLQELSRLREEVSSIKISNNLQ